MRRKVGSSAKKNKSSRRGGNDRKKQNMPIDQLIATATQAMASLDVERAAHFYSQAAAQLRVKQPQSEALMHVLEKLGECKVSMGDQEGAHEDFLNALDILEQITEDKNSMAYHETRSNLHLYTGQLCMDQEALETYRKGVESLEACLSLAQSDAMNDGNDETEAVLRQKLSGAYCTIAELYLTDLCFENNAETECEANLEKALQIKDSDGEPLVDALQTVASLRLSQESRRFEAVPFILRAYEKMKVGSEALAALVGLAEDSGDETSKNQEEATELKDVDAANNLPEFEFRCQTAKLLLECASLLKESNAPAGSGQNPEDQCLAAAISVLGSLLAQNDEVIEIWFLTGCAFSAKRPPLVDAAKFYLDRAMEMLLDTKKALEQEAQFADEEELKDLQEQLEENKVQVEDVQAKLGELGIQGDEINKMEED